MVAGCRSSSELHLSFNGFDINYLNSYYLNYQTYLLISIEQCKSKRSWLKGYKRVSSLSILGKFLAGLLRALFFGEKCATCVQFMECAGVR